MTYSQSIHICLLTAMMMYPLFIMFILAVVPFASGLVCEKGWRSTSTGCYYLSYPERLNWWQAVESCYRRGGYLVVIQDATENRIINNMIREDAKCSNWIGGYDLGHEGQWIWEHKKDPIKYFDWLRGQPNNGGSTQPQHCLEIWKENQNSYVWNDEACTFTRAYICESDPIQPIPPAVPSPPVQACVCPSGDDGSVLIKKIINFTGTLSLDGLPGYPDPNCGRIPQLDPRSAPDDPEIPPATQ